MLLWTVALRWFFFQAMWRCTESCLADVSSFFFLCDFPLFSSTPLCFFVFLLFYSSFLFFLPFPFSIPPIFIPFHFSYVLVSLLSFFFLFFLCLSISGPPLLSLCFFHLLCSKNSLSLFFGHHLIFSSPSPLFHPLKNVISSIFPVFFWYF